MGEKDFWDRAIVSSTRAKIILPFLGVNILPSAACPPAGT
jgi:hypothetical protein